MSIVELLILPDILSTGRQCGYIHKVYTDISSRNNGYASKLVTQAMDYAKSHDCHKVFLICNDETVPFYEKLGLERSQVGMVKRF